MKEISKLVKLSYGTDDLIFAGHNHEIQNAKKALILSLNENLSHGEYKQLHINYLKGKECIESHIKEQLKRVDNLNLYFEND